jgi:uncharacterized membrane protein
MASKKGARKPRRSAKKVLQQTGKAMGDTTKEVIHASAEMVTHPKKSAIILMNSSGEVLGEMNEDMLRAQDLMLKRTKRGMVIARARMGKARERMERMSGASKTASRPEYYRRLTYFFGPIAAAIIVITLYCIFLPWHEALPMVGTAVAYFFLIPGFDKVTMVLSANSFGLSPYSMAMNVFLLDMIVGTFLCFNFDYVTKLPVIGKLILSFESRGKLMLTRHPRIRRMTYAGVVLFLLLPIPGSGAYSAAIIGRLIGIQPAKLMLSIIPGSLFGCLLVAYLANLIAKYVPKWLEIAIPATLFCILVVAVAYNYLKQRKKEKLEQDAEEGLPS